MTHLFNAMRPFRHRDPGIAGAALARDDVVVQVILDGVHLAPETASVVWRAAAGRVALVTDAMAGAGLTDGSHRLGGLDIEIRDGVARGTQRRARRKHADHDRSRAEPARAGRIVRGDDHGGDRGACPDPAAPHRGPTGNRAPRGRGGPDRTTSRSSASSWTGASVSSAEVKAEEPPHGRGRAVPLRDRRAAGGSATPRGSRGGVPTRRRDDSRTLRDDDSHGRSRIVRQRRVVRDVRVRAPSRVDGAPRLDLADRVLRRGARHDGLHRPRALAVRPHSGRRGLPAARASERRIHSRHHQRRDVGARVRGGSGSPVVRGCRAGSRRDEDLHEPGRRTRAARCVLRERRAALRRGARGNGESHVRTSSRRCRSRSRASPFRSRSRAGCS